MKTKSLNSVIMAGGMGTRFWPLSRKNNPKQFIKLIEDKSFLTHTIDRISPITPPSHIWVVGNRDHARQLKEHAPTIPTSHHLHEPCGKNTAPCIAWAAFKLVQQDPEAIMIVLPADHMITPQDQFEATIHTAIDVASTGKLVTIGIPPTSPHTGYGYIETTPTKDPKSPSQQVIAFHEKPSKEMAESYLEKGDFYWNSGIFIWKASLILDQLHRHLPDIYTALDTATKSSDPTAIDTAYAHITAISIDYGIMEKCASLTHVIPAKFTWSDIGSWSALDEFLPKDTHQNASESPLISVKSTSNIVHAPHKTVTLIGVENLIVVDTGDALLITQKACDQDVKTVIDHLPEALR
jgi:mannose-1-phosphate guanylyltransferase